MEIKLIKTAKAYLRKKKIETVKKDKEIAVSKIVKEILSDKTNKQAIEMFLSIEHLFNKRLDENLKQSLESVEEISKFKNLNN